MNNDLTKREISIVDYVIEGHFNFSIAVQLGISEETVKRHLANVFLKRKVENRTELAVSVLRERHAKEVEHLLASQGCFDVQSN